MKSLQKRDEKVVSLPIRLIPFYNTTDTTRLQMGAKYIGFQAVPTKNSQIPYCLSDGFVEFSVLNDGMFIKRAEEDGVVIYSDPDKGIMVVYYDTTKRVETYEIPKIRRIGHAHEFATELTYYLETGEEFEEGDILYEYAGWKNGLPASGYNALTCIGSLNFLNYEDAVIISESFAKRAGYTEEREYIVDIYTYTKILPNSKGKLLPEIGEKYKNGEAVFIKAEYPDAKKVMDNYIEYLRKGKLDLVESVKKRIENLNKKLKNNPDALINKKSYIGISETSDYEEVVDVKVLKYSDKNISFDFDTQNTIDEKYNEYLKTKLNISEIISKNIWKLTGIKVNPKQIERKVVDRVLGYKKKNDGKINDQRRLVARIIIKTVYRNTFRAGHKISTSAASKGINAIVIPDELMPKVNGKPIDIFISPFAIPSRMTISQIYEFVTATIVHHAEELIKKGDIETALNILEDIVSIQSNKKIRDAQLKVIRKLKSTPKEKALSFMREEIELNGNLFVIVDSYKEPNAYDIRDLTEIANKYGIEIFDVKVTLNPRKIYQYLTGDENEYAELLPDEEITETVNTVGYMYIYYLEHVVEHKFNARSTGKYQSSTKLPPRGRKNKGGSKIGNDEIAMLVGYDSDNVINELVRLKADDHDNKRRFISAPILHGEIFSFKEHGTKPKPITFALLENLLNVSSLTLKKQK
jgi:DNA-directed RNA polymerase subunit beta